MALNNNKNNDNNNGNKYFLKPSIKFGNYFFVWPEIGYGLCLGEINSFKNFVKKMIPLLEQYMNLLTFDHNKKSSQQNNQVIYNNNNNNNKSQFCITEKYNKKTSFILLIDNKGSTFFYREEKFFVKTERFDNVENGNQAELVLYSNELSQPHLQTQQYNNNAVLLKWLLGELLFDRTKPR